VIEARGRESRWTRPLIGPFTPRHIVAVVAVLLAATLALAVLSTPIAAPPRPLAPVPGSGFYQLSEPTEGLSLGQLAPELEGIVGGETVGLRDLDGEPISLEALRGGPVWLSFFATWCPPCQEEMPVLREAHERYAGRGLGMVAVSVQETTADDVAAYAETYSLPYTIGFDATSAVFKTYAGFGLPTHVFIDEDGVIRDLRYGPLDLEQVGELVEPLLASSG
jgi:thiol-disulfide isomerase/thioredoxin